MSLIALFFAPLQDMKLVGLTGGIGSGKSTVAGIFEILGIPVYNSDLRAKLLMQENELLRTDIGKLFGDKAFLPDGSLNRKAIAGIVFNDPSQLQLLNAIVHPAVYQDLTQWMQEEKQQASPYLIQESAILFEENLTGRHTAVILVAADQELRIQRVVDRDGVTREQVLQRMKNQWPDEQKIPLADYVIYNDGERSLIDQVMDIHQMILS